MLIGPPVTNFRKSKSNFTYFHSRKLIWKCRLENNGHLSRPQCVNCSRYQCWNWSSPIRLPKCHWSNPGVYGYMWYRDPQQTGDTITTQPETTRHDDVIKWKHFPRYWPFVRGIHRSPLNSPHKGQWRGALMFTLICVWINDCVNNREAGDLRRYCAHCGVTIMYWVLGIVTRSYWAYCIYLSSGFQILCFTHILQAYLTGIGAILRLPQCQWSKSGHIKHNSTHVTTITMVKHRSCCELTKTPHISPSYGMYFVSYLEKDDREISISSLCTSDETLYPKG